MSATDYVVVDLFAGGGGTSTGAIRAITSRGRLAQLVAVNHWPIAVATHTANHPTASHYCMNLEVSDPADMVPGRRVDLLVASPECVHFSRARGGKPVNDQRRSGADWVLRWLERLDVRCLLIENVKEFMSWGDVDEKGRPVSQKRGRYFLAWLKRLGELGYAVDHRILNAADYGDVTTRERFFLIARKDGRPIRWPAPTHSKLGTSDMFGTLPKWRAAREIIDWSDLGPSIFEREALGLQPLSVKTRLRIGRGFQLYGGLLAPLYIRLLDLPTEDDERFIAKCADGPVRSFVIANRQNSVPVGVDRPAPTFTTATAGGVYLVRPEAIPFIVPNTENAVPKATTDPLGTITNIPGIYLAVPTAEPFVLSALGGGGPRHVDQPTPTATTTTVMRLVTPTLRPFLDLYYQTGVADSVDDPLSTVTTKPRHAVVSPVIVPFHVGARAKSERAHSPDDPLRTLTTEPRFGVATPTASVITPGFAERHGQAPRVHDIEKPVPGIAAQGHLHLATATVELPAAMAGVDPRRLVVIDGVLHLLDIRFRMLKNSELAAAMGFPPDYVFTGSKSDVTRQIGNAVCVSLATHLVDAILDPENALVSEAAS